MRFTAFLLLLATTACDAPWEVTMETSMVPPAIYRTWFYEVANCMARETDATDQRYALIEWFTADQINHREGSAHAIGLWVEPHRVVIRSDHLDRAYVVKHEIVHDLLGEGEHRSGLFRACAGI